MFQDDSSFTVVLVVLGLLVVGLSTTVVVLAKSLRAKRKAPPTVEARRSANNDARAKAAPQGSNFSAAAEDHPEEVTTVTTLADAQALPRLSVEQEESTDEEPSLEESIAKLFYDSEADVDIDEPTGAHDVIVLSAIGQTDRGVTRRRNEDAYVIDTNLQLYAVADGMGGYAGGDIASRMAIQEIRTALESPTDVKGHEDRPRRGRELIAAVENANAAVYRESRAARELHGMGTTVVAARFSPQKQRMYVAHVGDSRCYRFRRGQLQLLTSDHTLAARGVVGPLAKNICRAVGIAKTVKVDLIVDKPLPDDLFLLCSDGLPKMVTDEHIRRILTANEGALDRAAAQLVLAANASGGRDNITVVLVRILEVTKSMRTSGLLKKESRVEFGPS